MFFFFFFKIFLILDVKDVRLYIFFLFFFKLPEKGTNYMSLFLLPEASCTPSNLCSGG